MEKLGSGVEVSLLLHNLVHGHSNYLSEYSYIWRDVCYQNNLLITRVDLLFFLIEMG